MTQIKDFLMIVTLLITVYAGFNKVNSVAYWISGFLLLGVILINVYPMFKKWNSERGQKKISLKESAKEDVRIEEQLIQAKVLIKEYWDIVGEPDGMYSDSFSYIARDSKETTVIIYNSFYSKYLKILISHVDNHRNPKKTMIELAMGFGEVNHFVCENWPKVEESKRDVKFARQFVIRYNDKVGEIETFLKRVLPFTGEGTDPNSFSNYYFAKRFDRLT
jgi:hypothetical protein